MKLILKLLASVAILLVLGAATIFLLSELRLRRHYAVDPEPVAAATDVGAIARGAHVGQIRGCQGCHGDNLAGAAVIDDPKVAHIYGINLTRGAGGLPADYSDADFVRALRHGVGRDGHPLILMPSVEFAALSDADIGDLIAYIRSVPPVDSRMPRSTMGPIMRAVLLLDRRAQVLPAEWIDHEARRAVAPPATPAEQGRYLAMSCLYCHGEGFSGGKIPGVPPDWPAARNLTDGGGTKNWTESQFATAMRSGVTPDGRTLDPEHMPWPAFKGMTDEEIHALWQYLRSLPAKPDGNR